MIAAELSGDAFLADIQAARKESFGFHLWWLGQSGFLIQWNGRHLLLDPYLSDSLTKKYSSTDKPHIRMTELIISPGRLDFIDAVTSSHNHTDHLDGETLGPLLSSNKELKLIVPEANLPFAANRLNVPESRLTGIDDGSLVETSGFTIHGVPAAHETVERDEQGRCRFLGYIIQFDRWTIYHSGDTMLYDTIIRRLSNWDIDVAILPINGRAPERRVSGNLWGREAAQLAQDIGAGIVIPCHYDMFTFNTATPKEFITTAEELGQKFQILKCGQRWSSTQLTE